MVAEVETMSKLIHDKERQLKQSAREIQHQEGNLRVNKTKLQEIIEQLNKKEMDLKNSEKDVNNL